MATMPHSLLSLYQLIGRDDKVGLLEFKVESDAYQKYGDTINVMLEYTQSERESMEELLAANSPDSHTTGFVKVRYLGYQLSKDKREQLRTNGVHSTDINSVYYLNAPADNTFHQEDTRAVKTHIIPMPVLPKGRDYDWMYGFAKARLKDGVGFTPHEKDFYLAAKLYFESATVTDEEREVMYENCMLTDGIGEEYYRLKIAREEPLSEDETQHAGAIIQARYNRGFASLGQALVESGSSMAKLFTKNREQAVDLYQKAVGFNDRRLCVKGSVPIYLDLNGYLHVYMRHVREMKVGKNFEHKDNFQWVEADVLMVIESVIKEIEAAAQAFWKERPSRRYSRYGSQSIYYLGDYYTLHIEADGRISTFHKNRKKKAGIAD